MTDVETTRLQIEAHRLSVEEKRFGLESQRTYLEQWKVEVEPVDEQALEASKAAIQFAQSVLRGAFLINGGALIVLPTFATAILGNGLRSAAIHLSTPISSFAAGLLLDVMATFCAYVSLAKNAQHAYTRSELAKITVNEQHGRLKNAEVAKHDRSNAAARAERAKRLTQCWGNAAIVLVALSLLAFVVGAVAGATLLASH